MDASGSRKGRWSLRRRVGGSYGEGAGSVTRVGAEPVEVDAHVAASDHERRCCFIGQGNRGSVLDPARRRWSLGQIQRHRLRSGQRGVSAPATVRRLSLRAGDPGAVRAHTRSRWHRSRTAVARSEASSRSGPSGHDGQGGSGSSATRSGGGVMASFPTCTTRSADRSDSLTTPPSPSTSSSHCPSSPFSPGVATKPVSATCGAATRSSPGSSAAPQSTPPGSPSRLGDEHPVGMRESQSRPGHPRRRQRNSAARSRLPSG